MILSRLKNWLKPLNAEKVDLASKTRAAIDFKSVKAYNFCAINSQGHLAGEKSFHFRIWIKIIDFW